MAASAPFPAQGVKRLADENFPVDKEHPDNANLLAKVIGHAIVGLAVAEGSGNNGLSGALGAASGELIAKTIAEDLYHKDPTKLTEAERQFIANMTSIATGVAAGLIADNTADAGTAALAAYNAATNNYLSQPEKTELDLAKQKLNDPDPLVREKAQQDYDRLMEKDISSDQAVIDACGNGQAGSAGCASARQDAAAARDSYETGSYNSQAKKQYADAYGQVVNLLNSTSVDAQHKEQVTDGLARYFMAATGVDYETARAYAATKQGMDIIVASVALGANLQTVHSYLAAEGAVAKAVAVKPYYNWSASEGEFSINVKGNVINLNKNSDGFHEVAVNLTPTGGQTRLNTLDLTGNGQLKPAEAAAGAKMELLFGEMERVPNSKNGLPSADYIITGGPNKGLTVDFMYTTKALSENEIAGINKFFEKNMTIPRNSGETPSGQKQIIDHLKKADIVPVDFSVLTPENQKVFIDFVKTLSEAQQNKIVIIR